MVVHRTFRHRHGRHGRREVLSMFKTVAQSRRGGRSLTGRSKEEGGRHRHRHGGRMDAQWSAIGRPVKNTYCCEHCVSIWATLLPSLYHHCASFGRPIASIDCPACRTTLVATRFRVAVICPIIQVPHCIRVFFYFVWFVFINHIFQFYYELCTYCNILDIYLS